MNNLPIIAITIAVALLIIRGIEGGTKVTPHFYNAASELCVKNDGLNYVQASAVRNNWNMSSVSVYCNDGATFETKIPKRSEAQGTGL